MEVINANCLAREADFSFLVGIPQKKKKKKLRWVSKQIYD